MNRRQYLALGAGVGASSLSGCAFLAEARTPAPQVPTETLANGGWTKTVDTAETVFEEDYGPLTVQAVAHTVQYIDEALQARVSERTLDQLESALSVFFATRVDFSPNLDNLPAGAGQGEILDQVQASSREQFDQQMRAQGLTEIEETGTGTIDVDTGETAETTELTAVFPFEGLGFDVTADDRVAIPPADIEVTGLLAVWHHGDFVLIAGGAHPAQNFKKSIEESLSDGITVSVDVDLGLEPTAYREEMRRLVAGVQ